MERQKIIEQIMDDFGLLKRKIIAARHHRHKHSITPAQGQVLFSVRHHRQLTTSDLAKILGISVSATTQLCEPLIQNGYLLRQPNPKDGRSFTLSLSRSCSRHLARSKNNALIQINRLFEPLSDSDLAHFSRFMGKIINHLDENGKNS